MDWNDDDDSRYMDFGPQQTPEELEAERWDKYDTFIEEEDVFSWWETHFSRDTKNFDIMMLGEETPLITLAERVRQEVNPIQYFDHLISLLIQQENAIINWLVDQEHYELCSAVKSTAKKILTGLVTLKHKIKQVHEEEKETPYFVTVRLL